MNRKQLLLLLVALALVGGAGLVLVKHNKESWSLPDTKMGEKVLPNFPYNEVAAIHVKRDTELNVVRKDGLWRVQERGDYPANFHQISDLLLKIKNLKVVQSETADSTQLAQVDLLEPGNGNASGTLVEFKDAQGKVLDALLLGKAHMPDPNAPGISPLRAGSPDGRYILLRSDPKDVLLISDSLGSLTPMPEFWLSKDFIKVVKVKSLSVVSTNTADSWKVSRETETAPWVLADAKAGEVLDTNKVSVAVNVLSSPGFADIVMNTDPAATGLDKPTVMTIETFDKFTYTLKIGGKSPDGNHFMTVAVAADISAGDKAKALQEKLRQEKAMASWVYLVSSWIAEPLARDRAQIIMGKQEQVTENNASTSDSQSPVFLKPGVNPGVVK